MLRSALHRAKIEEAKRLIRRGSHNFSEIAGMLCCNDPHCFSRVFRRLTNMSPNDHGFLQFPVRHPFQTFMLNHLPPRMRI